MKIMPFILAASLFFSACAATPAPTELRADTPWEQTQAPTSLPTVSTETAADPTQAQLSTFFLYSPDENADGFLTTPITVQQPDARQILTLLMDANVLNRDIQLNTAEITEDQINLDFSIAFRDQLVTYGTAGERMMMGSVVNTYISAFRVQSVYITVEGEVLESGHVIYDFPMGFID